MKIRSFSDRRTICGLDISKSMLNIAVRNIRKTGVQGVDCMQGDMKRLPFADGSVDMVVSHVALHHLPDPIQMLRETARVLKPGGAFLIRDLVRPRNRLLVALYVRIFGGGGRMMPLRKNCTGSPSWPGLPQAS
ncbi:MAG: class I SAM-dependent methyltransferase [Deltaproteobacteria bacterium]|nr:class I SAM-dependent methyltransferase [Deltaproteobacteria bacterium]